MTDTDQIALDRAEITALIQRQFAALCWDEQTPPNIQALTDAYLPEASLFASARPAMAQTAAAFGARMASLRDTGKLPVFDEKGRGLHIWIAGGVAVALAGCEMHEGPETITEDISAFLLVRNPDGWSIASQAWDVLPSITDAFAANGLDAKPFFPG